MLGFVGPNGAGKTTAMRVVLGSSSGPRARSAGAAGPLRTTSDGASATCPKNRGFYPKMRVRDHPLASRSVPATASKNPRWATSSAFSSAPRSFTVAGATGARRAILGEAAPAEVVLSIVITMVAAIALKPIAGRLHSGGILRTGGAVKPREASRSSLP